jgi:hypothetical protein
MDEADTALLTMAQCGLLSPKKEIKTLKNLLLYKMLLMWWR